jgi:mono/diheme cytochrome c family protein
MLPLSRSKGPQQRARAALAIAAAAVAVWPMLAPLRAAEFTPHPNDPSVLFASRHSAGDNTDRVALGERSYATHCASCHGANLQGQPKWMERLPTGRLPAPPHDQTGHTWHHADDELFKITKFGLSAVVPGY